MTVRDERRSAGFGGSRRPIRSSLGVPGGPVITPEKEVIANGAANLVVANGVQVVAG